MGEICARLPQCAKPDQNGGDCAHGSYFSLFRGVGQWDSEIDSFVIATQNRSLGGVGIVRADGAVGASILAVGVVDARGAVGTAVFAVRVRNRIRIVGICAEFAEILSVGSDDLWGFGGVGI